MLKSVMGVDVLDVALDHASPWTVGRLLDKLVAEHPALAPLRPSLLLARNNRFAPVDEQLVDGDRIDLMPPVSGG